MDGPCGAPTGRHPAPTVSGTSDAVRVTIAESSLTEDFGRGGVRIRVGMSRRMRIAPMLLLLGVWPCTAAAGRTPLASSRPAVSFVGLPSGWHSFRDDGAVATSWAYRPGRSTGGWADYLPPGGIAVSVFFPMVTTTLRPLKLILPSRPATFLEGTTDTREYRIQGRVLGRDVYVWVDIRRKRPTAHDLRIAQKVVSSIRFA